MKKLILGLVAMMAVVMLVGCGQADGEEMKVYNSLEEATGMEWEIYEMETFGGKECDANSYFQPDTGAEIWVMKYSDTYAEVGVNFGNIEDVETQCKILSAMEELYEEAVINEMYTINGGALDMNLGGF